MTIKESHLAVDLEMVRELRSVRISDVANFVINIINDPSREKLTHFVPCYLEDCRKRALDFTLF